MKEICGGSILFLSPLCLLLLSRLAALILRKRKCLYQESGAEPLEKTIDRNLLFCSAGIVASVFLHSLYGREYPISAALLGFYSLYVFQRASASVYTLNCRSVFRISYLWTVILFVLLMMAFVICGNYERPVGSGLFHLCFILAMIPVPVIIFGHVARQIAEGFWSTPMVPVSEARRSGMLRIFILDSVFSYFLLIAFPSSVLAHLSLGLFFGLNLVCLIYLFSNSRLKKGLCRKNVPEDRFVLNIVKERLIAFFEEEKPYLKADLKINDVALAVFTNKTYVSRVLNESMNMNFNQYVNSYRIREAQRMYRENQELKMNELSELCGFRTVPSFYKAFRENVGDSPANWCRKYRNGELKEVSHES